MKKLKTSFNGWCQLLWSGTNANQYKDTDLIGWVNNNAFQLNNKLRIPLHSDIATGNDLT